MRRNRQAAVLSMGLAGAVLATSLLGDAQQLPPSRAAGTVNTGVTAVLADVVVRDKRGMPVKDLQAADFEVLEDGVPQTIGSFTGIFEDTPGPGATAETAPAAAPAVSAPAAGPRPDPMAPPVTALVFDRLSPEAQGLAIRAAKSYFSGQNKKEAPSYVGVFSIEGSLRPVTPFTRNLEQIEKGLDEMQRRGSASFGIDRERKRQVAQQAESAQQTADAATSAAGRGGAQGIGSSPATAALAQMESRMLTNFEALERDEQGYSQVNSLFAIIEALRPLPGRKSVVLFSEGVSIPPAVLRLFTGVIDAANRANVSIYTMDAAGLRVESEQRKIGDQVNEEAKRGLTSYASSSRGGGNEPLTKGLERNEAVLRQDPHTGLGELAQSTGGQLFENTNNLGTGFARLESDLRNYYLLGYTSTNATYDGKFRTIEVRVKRPGLTIAARKGYFAVRDTGGAPVNTWEAPALGALDQTPVPNAFPFRAAALSFPSKDTPGAVPVLVHLKTAPMSFPLTEEQKNFESDFAIVVRFLDSQGKVARKVSQHYEMSGEVARLPIARNSEVLFYREPVLPPGVYTMQAIVYDNPSRKASVRYSTVEVPSVDPKTLRISSLILVDRGEQVPAGERKDSPLFVKDVLIYPNLTGEVSKSAKELGFFFTVYPGTTTSVPQAVLDVIQNGKRLAELPLPLDPADGSGRIQQVGRLPLDALAPGTYELRAIVKQGADQVYSSVMVRVSG
jgi:VWFA-related protein